MPSVHAPDNVRSILLVRLSARGDVVFSTAILPALRRRFPDARMTWVVERESADMIRFHPLLDRVLIMPRKQWKQQMKDGDIRGTIAEIREFAKELRADSYDLAIDLQGLLRSGLVAYFSGAPVRIGIGSKEGSSVLMTQNYPRGGHDLWRISSQEYAFARDMGLDVSDFPMDLHLDPSQDQVAADLVRDRGWADGFIALFPFTTRPQKHWFEDRWAALADRIVDEIGLPTVFLGAPNDVPAMERIQGQARHTHGSLVGETSLGVSAAVIKHASAGVGVDTGMAHMSIAFGRPSLTLMGSTSPYLETGTPTARVLYHRMDCSPCHRSPTCGGAFTCMTLISVDEVVTNLQAVLAAEVGT
jgi:heptosyltransferase-1